MLAKALDSYWQKLARLAPPAKACERCFAHECLRKLWTIVDKSLRDQFCPRKLVKVVLCINDCESSGQLLTTACEISSARENLGKLYCAWMLAKALGSCWQQLTRSVPPAKACERCCAHDNLEAIAPHPLEATASNLEAMACESCWQKLAKSIPPARSGESCFAHECLRTPWAAVDKSLRIPSSISQRASCHAGHLLMWITGAIAQPYQQQC